MEKTVTDVPRLRPVARPSSVALRSKPLPPSQRVRLALRLLGVIDDWPSRLRLVRFKLREKLGLVSAGEALVPLRLRPLGGKVLHVRPGTSDTAVIGHNYLKDHAPFSGRDLRQICELGANIGAALAGYAVRHPKARLLGVEADPGNAALARRNLSQFGDRCRLVNAAVWDHETELVIGGEREDLRFVREPGESLSGGAARVPARTIDSLLDEQMPEGPIDFMQMSIEGSEERVLAGESGGLERVRSIRVETHPDVGFTSAACLRALDRLGFDAWIVAERGGDHCLGVRRAAASSRS